MKKIILLSLLYFSCIYGAVSQDADSMKIRNLKEVNVVATRIEKRNAETPRSITVITSDDLIQNGYSSVADALSDAAGIYITGNGQVPGSNESIFMRGANSNQTVILLDGVRISDASTVNNTADLSELSINDIDRIEIVRGAHSTYFGSGAVGGVVSIKTKHASHQGINAKASVTGGTFGNGTFDRRAGALLGYKFKNGFSAEAGIEKIHVDGDDATIDTVTDPARLVHRDRDDWDRTIYQGSAGFQNHAIKAALNFKATEMLTDLDKGAYTDDDNYTMDFKRKLANGSVNLKLGKNISTQLNAGYTETRRHSVNDSSITDASGDYDHTNFENTYSGKVTSADWQVNGEYENFDFVAGLSGNIEDMDQEDYYYYSTDFGPFEYLNQLDTLTPLTTTAIFLHTEVNGAILKPILSETISKLLDRYTLSLGARLGNHPVSGSQFSYDVTLKIKTGESAILYFSNSTGYNNPSLYQLYAPETYTPFDGSAAINLTRGNKNLKAEEAMAYEVGIKQKAGDLFEYSISFFHSVTNNLVEYVYLWNPDISIADLGNDPFNRDDYRGDRYLNIGKQRTTGVELNILASLSKKLKLSANATLINGEIEYNPSTSIQAQTGGAQAQLYSTGAFLNAQSKSTGLARRPGEATLKLIYSPHLKIHIAPCLKYVAPRNDIFYDASLGPFGALATKAVEAYTLAGMSFSWDIRKGLSLNIKGDNLLNEDYQEIYGFTTRKRSVYMTIGFNY